MLLRHPTNNNKMQVTRAKLEGLAQTICHFLSRPGDSGLECAAMITERLHGFRGGPTVEIVELQRRLKC